MQNPLSPLERRVLGVLVEKALTAAAPEPLTLNAVVVGSNQKSNRDPVFALEEPEVDSTLEQLQRKGLVFRITGGRAERWRHNLYDAWQVSKPQLALVAELLLRGPQTAAEARSRASRMEPLDQDMASAAISTLVERGFILWLTPESRRGAVLTHGFHTPEEIQRLKAIHSGNAPADERIVLPTTGSQFATTPEKDPRLENALVEIASLRSEVTRLRSIVEGLQEALGITTSQNNLPTE
jgi:uncharacterized protein YceH (UPF0502 family)